MKLSDLYVDFFLNVIPVVLGVEGCSRRCRNLVRCFLIFCHVYATVYTIVYCYYTYNLTYSTLTLQCVSCGAYTNICLHSHLVYMWRLRAGRLERWKARLDGPAAVSLLTLICLLIAISYDLTAGIPEYWLEVASGTVIYISGETAFFLCQLLNTIITVEMTFVLGSEADRIGKLTADDFRDGHCQRIASICTRLSQTFGFPLNVTHIVYFLILITQIPVKASRIATAEVNLYDKLHHSRLLLEFLIVVRSGNRILENRRLLRKRLKKSPEFFSAEVNEVQVFAKQDYGITFLMGSSLSFRSFWDFLSLSWGFTLMVVQFGVDPGTRS